MAFSLVKSGNADIKIVQPAGPGLPFKVQYNLPYRGARLWITFQYTKDVANLLANLWTRSGEVAPVVVQLVKRDGSGALVDDPITLSATKTCRFPMEIGKDVDFVELQILPSSLLGNDILKVGLSVEP